MSRRLPKRLLKSLRKLDETERFFLGHSYEDAYLVKKSSNETWEVGRHYSDPSCGLIDPGETWCLVGGEGLTFFKLKGEVREFLRKDQKTHFVQSIQLKKDNIVIVLLESGSRYELDISELKLKKVWI